MDQDAEHLRDELRALVEPGLARYLPILPVRAPAHFRGGAIFLLEMHPGAFRWLETVHAAGESAAPGATITDQIDRDVAVGIAALLGLRPPRMAEREDLADIVLHEAEGGMRFIVRATFPQHVEVDACRRELGRFVDLAYASMFAGLVAALFRRYEASPESFGSSLGVHFVWVTALFQRLDLGERDAFTFGRYFMRPGSARAVAKHRKSTLAEEQGHVFRFLENLAAFVEAEAPAVERELKADRTKLTRGSAPWANTILMREIGSERGRSKKRRRS